MNAKESGTTDAADDDDFLHQFNLAEGEIFPTSCLINWIWKPLNMIDSSPKLVARLFLDWNV